MENVFEKLSNEDKDRLISLVRENPCLYQHTAKSNKDNLLKENSWISITKIMLEGKYEIQVNSKEFAKGIQSKLFTLLIRHFERDLIIDVFLQIS